MPNPIHHYWCSKLKSRALHQLVVSSGHIKVLLPSYKTKNHPSLLVNSIERQMCQNLFISRTPTLHPELYTD